VAKTFFSFYVFVCDVARKNICDRHRPFYNQQNILLIIKSEKLFIAYKDSIKLEIGSDFSTTFTSLLALFFVFNIPYALENEKILGFFQEALGFKILVHYDSIRNRQYSTLLTSVQ
jgi:hypothetical protein